MFHFIRDFESICKTVATDVKTAAEDLNPEKLINCAMINFIVNQAPHRPHPWSTMSPYTSWASLTDMTWSARCLPEVPLPPNMPTEEQAAEMFRRREPQVMSKKSTLVFPAFAQYLTDGFIRTIMPPSSQDTDSNPARKRNDSNHEIDLCPLYGRTRAQTAVLRLNSEKAGEKGRLKSQMISGEEYPPYLYGDDGTVDPLYGCLDAPLGVDNNTPIELRRHLFATGGDRANTAPQIALMASLWLREHNRVAQALEDAYSGWDDERVFQTARCVVIVEYIKIVVEDYINHINPLPFKFTADPSVAWNAPWNKPNWITTEFSLLYRWHSLIPDEVTWNGTAIPVGDTFFDNSLLFKSSMADAFVGLSEQKTSKLGTFNTADAIWPFEVRTIRQGRICRLQPFVAYKKFASQTPPTTFEELNPDAEVAGKLKELYGTVDRVEFHVGLFSEPANDDSPCPQLLGTMVAIDAFSQALTNPLLSQYVFNEATFSTVGWSIINDTSTLEQIVERNCPGLNGRRVTMTQPSWTRTETIHDIRQLIG